MLRRIARTILAAAVLAVAAAAVLHWGFDVTMRLDGSGMPRIVRELPAPKVAARVESHRAAAPSPPTAPRPAQQADNTAQLAEDTAQQADNPAQQAQHDGNLATATATRRPDAAGGAASSAPPPYWTGFRGPLRDGVYREGPIRTSWPASGLTPMWKQPIGGGYASFAVAGGRAFTIEQRRGKEVVTAYDVRTGRELWAHAWDGVFQEWMGGDGPRATPAWADGRVYALGALGELRCLDDRTGGMIWRVNILDDNSAGNLPWGMAASPLVVDDLVVVLPGGPAGRSVAAYDRASGKRRWTALSDKQAYSAPMLVTIGGTRQILNLTGTRLVALTTAGELLWEYPWPTANDINASQPVILPPGNRVLLSSGYGHGAALLEVTHQGGRFGTRLLWEHTRLKNRFSSSVEHEGYIYGLDENILTCLDAATGDVKWKSGRYGHGQFVLASGHLVLLSEGGELVLIRATPESHREVARFPVLEGKTWNHPAIDRGVLLVRNLAEMAAFDLRVP